VTAYLTVLQLLLDESLNVEKPVLLFEKIGALQHDNEANQDLNKISSAHYTKQKVTGVSRLDGDKSHEKI
jgi:hypothetical protein